MPNKSSFLLARKQAVCRHPMQKFLLREGGGANQTWTPNAFGRPTSGIIGCFVTTNIEKILEPLLEVFFLFCVSNFFLLLYFKFMIFSYFWTSFKNEDIFKILECVLNLWTFVKFRNIFKIHEDCFLSLATFFQNLETCFEIQKHLLNSWVF